MLRTSRMATLFGLAALLTAACGKDSTAPPPPPPPSENTRWTSIKTYLCPVDAQNASQCTTETTSDTLLVSRYYLQTHIWEGGAQYLRAALSWAADSAGCGQAPLENGRCVVRVTFGPYRNTLGIVISLVEPNTYRIDWSLAAGANSASLADTSFTYVVPAASAGASVTASRTPVRLSPRISLPW